MNLKIIAALTILAFAAGCHPERHDNGSHLGLAAGLYGYATSAETIKGHEYIIVRGGEGVCIIHSESCPCKK